MPATKRSELGSVEFVNSIVKEIRRGWGIVPFTGSGISARSGILMGMEFTEYLTWAVFRCVAEEDELEKVVKTRIRWNIRENGWPRPPRPDESNGICDWVLMHFRKLCKKQGLNVYLADNTKIVSVLTPFQPNEGPAFLDEYLRRPMLPSVLRKWGLTNVDDDGVRQFLRLIGEEQLVRTVLTQPYLSPDSEEAVIEMAVRSLYDWRAMLEFLARVRLRNVLSSQGINPEVRPYLGERDPSVIDGFNRHITQGRKPNLAHAMICHLAGPLRTRVVLTTNFDTLQEEAFKQINEEFNVIPVSIRGELPSQESVHANNCIVKLHGEKSETRADYSLDSTPPISDKARFFHYICGQYPLGLTGGDYCQENGGRFIPNHLLVCGYSGNDPRCVHLIKYVLDHSADTKIFWICFDKNDFERIDKLFGETEYRDRIFLTTNERVDLLFLELYQSLTLRLPEGGCSYQYSHDVPPKLWDPIPGLEEKLKASVNNIISEVKQLSGKSDNSNKAVWVEVKPSGEDGKRNATGLTVVLHYALKQLRETENLSVIWIEMEDYSDAFAILHYILQIISLRLGLFQLEHAVLVPGRMAEMLRLCQTAPEKLRVWQKVVDRIIRYFDIQPGEYAVFFYGRNVPGMCAGWEGIPWNESKYIDFHHMIKAMTNSGFRVVYAPLTQPRIDRDIEKASMVKIAAKNLQTLANWNPAETVRAEFNDWVGRISYQLDHSGNKEEVDNFDNDIFKFVECDPEHGDVPSLEKILQKFYKNDLREMRESPEIEKFQSMFDLTGKLHSLFTSTYFRCSRPPNVFISEPVFPSPHQFNLSGFDNDWYRMGEAEKWLMSYREEKLLWRKPGGNYWFFRDARLSLRYLLGHCVVIEGFKNWPLSDFPAQQTAHFHYLISQWYFRAYCATNNALPLCEALYHLYKSVIRLEYASPTAENSELRIAGAPQYRKYLWVRSVTEWIKILRVGRKSLLFWLDRLAARPWFDPKEVSTILKKVEDQMYQLFNATDDEVDPNRLGTWGYALGLLRELRTEMSSCWDEFTREHAFPDLIFDAVPPINSLPNNVLIEQSGDIDAFSKWHSDTFALAKADLFHRQINCWRRSSDPLDRSRHLIVGQPAISEWRLDSILSELESEESAPQEDGKDFYKKVRNLCRDQLWHLDAYRDLPKVITILQYLSFEHIRRAKIIEDSCSFDILSKFDYLIPATKEARPIWRHVNILSRLVLVACSMTPAALFQFELSQRVKVLGHHGLALGHLGRFYEAHRRLNEAAALLSKLDRRADTVDLATIKLQSAEVHLMEANQIKSIKRLSEAREKLGKKFEEFIRTKGKEFTNEIKQAVADLRERYLNGIIDGDAAIAWFIFARADKTFDKNSTWLENSLGFFVKTPPLTKQLIERYGYQNSFQYNQMVCAKVDDAWASLESAEHLLGDQSRTTHLGGRLCALKLQILAHHPPQPFFRTLPLRNQIEIDEILRSVFRLGFAVWPDDPFRRIRLADYFFSAWVQLPPGNDNDRLALLSQTDADLIYEAFDNCGYKVDLTKVVKRSDVLFYLEEYAINFKSRLTRTDKFRNLFGN